MQETDAQKLFSKYQSGKCSPEEQAIVENWLVFGDARPDDLTDAELAADLEDIRLSIPLLNETKSRRLWPLIAAAAILLVLSSGLFFYINKTGSATGLVLSPEQDIAPGTDKATLTLADGKTIILNDADNAALLKQSGLNIVKAANGQLVYQATANQNSAAVINILTTPLGGQYQLVLPDGSKVWLNSASSLKFPSNFNNLKNREVTLKGEAYFEITKDKKHPFIVQSDRQVVEVLGTHFNVSNYDSERSAKTTLIEGQVKVARLGSGSYQLLRPGQRSKISGESVLLENVDVEVDIAWKNGYFKFTDHTIEEIMGQISRWYDVEVSYEGKANNERYSGRISRHKNISQVLKMIESAQSVHFKVEGRRIVVIQ